MTNIHRPKIKRVRQATVAALVAIAALGLTVTVGAASAQADPPKPTLISQVPFVMPHWPDAGIPVNATATIWNLPSTVSEGDVIAWVTCEGPSTPSLYPVTKTIDHTSRRLLLTTVIETRTTDTNCVLNAVPTAIGTHIAFFPQDVDARNGEIHMDGNYVVEGITVG